MIPNALTMPQMGVVVGLPCHGPVMPEWGVALATQCWPTNTNVCYVPIRNVPRDKAREMIVEGAQQLKSEYIWMVDSDVEVPYGACRQLMKTMKEAPDDVMIVGGIYSSKQLPSEPIVYRKNGIGPFWRWKRDTIFDCSLIGTGCMLIKTELFSKIEKPWFKDVDEPTIKITDDGWFCAKVQQAGFKILADAHVLCVHWDSRTETPYHLAEDSYPMLPLGKEALFRNLPEGWMNPQELAWLSDQAAKHRRIVEIGCFLGRSTVMMARSTEGEVWAIDDFKGPRDTVPRSEKSSKLLKITNILAQFQENTSELPNVFWIQTDHADFSQLPPEWLRGSPEEKPDMVFIDGSHEYEDVKRDIMAWRERLRHGGLLCGHDADWPGVRKALNELLPGWKLEAGNIWSAP